MHSNTSNVEGRKVVEEILDALRRAGGSLLVRPEDLQIAMQKHGLVGADIGTSDQEIADLTRRYGIALAKAIILDFRNDGVEDFYTIDDLQKVMRKYDLVAADIGTTDRELKDLKRRFAIDEVKWIVASIPYNKWSSRMPHGKRTFDDLRQAMRRHGLVAADIGMTNREIGELRKKYY